MELDDILPINLIRLMFPGVELEIEAFGLPHFDSIVRQDGPSVFALAANVYNRVRIYQWTDVDLRLLGAEMDSHDPELCEKFSGLLGEPVVKNINWTRVSAGGRPVAEIMVSHVFPNDVQLTKILLQNPFIPSRGDLNEYKGLGLFGEVVRRMEEFAKERRCGQISLTASSGHLVSFFEKFGFRVMAQFPRHLFPPTVGGPMELNVGERGRFAST